MVKVGITGVPGVGKTTTAKLLSNDLGYDLLDVNSLAADFQIDVYDDSKVIDTDRLQDSLFGKLRDDVILESHLLCNMALDLDFVFVLRCHPNELTDRLIKKGWSDKKVETNVEAEALDYCLINSEDNYSHVYQIDTSTRNPQQVVEKIKGIMFNGDSGEVVDWSDWLFNKL